MNPHPNPLQPDWAAALLDPERPPPPGLRAWNGSDPARRFAVHRNNVVASLVSAALVVSAVAPSTGTPAGVMPSSPAGVSAPRTS